MIRLDRMLSNSGFGTRKEVKYIVKAGRVEIDGIVIKDPSAHVDTYKSEILIDKKPFVYREFVYLMLNKPAGYVSATTDNQFPTVIDLVPDEYMHYELFPCGRLDKDTEGLLLITNDGQLSHNLLSPKKHVPKVYYAKIDKPVTEDDAKAFLQGVVLEDGYKTLPAQLNILSSGTPSIIELTIMEGKFHQVKRMFESVDKKVLFLKRVSFGPLILDNDLPIGEIRELTDSELAMLQQN